MLLKINSYLDRAIDCVLPARCVITGEPVERQGMLSPQVWGELNFIAAPQCKTCGVPFEFDMQADICANCLDYPPIFDSARSSLRYDDDSRSLILGFKHGDQTLAVKAFMPWMMSAGGEMLGACDMIVPVPLHYWRIVRRRYNQAALIAAELSRETGKPAILDLLNRTRATMPQGHLKVGERRKNVSKAFALNPKCDESVKGKHIVLIDDVLTSGSTVNECTKVLKESGAKRVDVLTLARVVKN